MIISNFHHHKKHQNIHENWFSHKDSEKFCRKLVIFVIWKNDENRNQCNTITIEISPFFDRKIQNNIVIHSTSESMWFNIIHKMLGFPIHIIIWILMVFREWSVVYHSCIHGVCIVLMHKMRAVWNGNEDREPSIFSGESMDDLAVADNRYTESGWYEYLQSVQWLIGRTRNKYSWPTIYPSPYGTAKWYEIERRSNYCLLSRLSDWLCTWQLRCKWGCGLMDPNVTTL